jgi:hypothetical protein
MLKMIFLLAGLAVGFGAGVYWGVHHPVEAKNLAEAEERKAIEYKIAVTQAVKQKLDEIINKKSANPPAGASGFVSGGGGGGGGRRTVDPDLVQARNEEDQELQQLRQRLASMPKK